MIDCQSPAANCIHERFWNKVAFSDGCWLWQGGLDQDGYGKFFVAGRTVGAHRWLLESVGRIGPGEVADHLCRQPRCVRPSHLESVTNQVNVLRGEGISAIAARTTHCPNGHPYDLFNTYYEATGSRRCRACVTAYNKARWAARGQHAGGEA